MLFEEYLKNMRVKDAKKEIELYYSEMMSLIDYNNPFIYLVFAEISYIELKIYGIEEKHLKNLYMFIKDIKLNYKIDKCDSFKNNLGFNYNPVLFNYLFILSNLDDLYFESKINGESKSYLNNYYEFLKDVHKTYSPLIYEIIYKEDNKKSKSKKAR